MASRFLGFVVAVLLACPVASAPGVTPDAVVFGQSACFSGPNERLGMHYRAGIMAAFQRAMLDGARPVIYGDGLALRDYVHVSDVVEAHRLALHMRGDGVFNIASGTTRTLRQVFGAVARAAGYDGEPVYAQARPGELSGSRLDVKQARRVLRWRAQVPFARGIAQTVHSMRAQAVDKAPAAALQ